MSLYRCSRKPMCPQAVWVFAALFAAISLLAGCNRKAEVAADQSVPVRLRTPRQIHELASVFVSGSVEANVTAQTSFQVSGRVARVLVEQGQHVNRGQILAELDCTDYRNAYEAALGQATAADASALQSKNGPRKQELAQARIDFEHAQDDYRRNKYLYDHQSLAANDFQQFKAAYLASQQRYDMTLQGTRTEQKKETAGEANAANAELSEARKHLADCRLRAPIAGFIGMRKVDVGDTVASDSAVFSVLDLDPVKVRVGIPEAEIGIVHQGTRAVVTIPSLDDRQFEGKVQVIGVSADAVSRTFTTKIAVSNPTHVLRDGMVAEARIYGSTMKDALTVPALAIVHDLRGIPLVYVYDGTRQRAFARQIDVGELIGDEVEVKSGLTPNDRIVIAGQNNVHEGSMVQVEGGAR